MQPSADIPASMLRREVIFEFYPIGPYVRVAAMDAASLTEISVQCYSNSSQEFMKRQALKRLAYILKKKGIIKD